MQIFQLVLSSNIKGLFFIVSILGLMSFGAILIGEDKECKADVSFQLQFEKHLKRLSNFALVDFESEPIDSVLVSVGFINAITEIQSQIYLGDVVVYGRKEFRKDRRLWLRWYKSHRCSITQVKADSWMKVNVDLRPDYSSKWPSPDFY